MYISYILAGYVFVLTGFYSEWEEAFIGLQLILVLMATVMSFIVLWAIWYIIKSEKI